MIYYPDKMSGYQNISAVLISGQLTYPDIEVVLYIVWLDLQMEFY